MYTMYFDHIHHTPTSNSIWILPLTDYLMLEGYTRHLKGGENTNMNVCVSDMVCALAGLELAMNLL